MYIHKCDQYCELFKTGSLSYADQEVLADPIVANLPRTGGVYARGPGLLDYSLILLISLTARTMFHILKFFPHI
jgi:hypothetical protein